MSERREKRTETRTYDAVVEVRCDLCGKQAPRPGDRSPWVAESGSRHDDPVVELKTGRSWPNEGFGETVKVDICPACFRDRLIPWLREQGAEPRTEEWSW